MLARMSPLQNPTVTISRWRRHAAARLRHLAGQRRRYDAVRAALRSATGTSTPPRCTATRPRSARRCGTAACRATTSSSPPSCRPARQARARTLEQSLRSLGIDHVDLWLIHWPPGGADATDIWAEFIEARDAGLTRYIGVSNYSTRRRSTCSSRTGEAPGGNQIPWARRSRTRTWWAAPRTRRGVEGYSAFKPTDLRAPGSGRDRRAHGVTPHQVVVRWHVAARLSWSSRSRRRPTGSPANFDVFGFALTRTRSPHRRARELTRGSGVPRNRKAPPERGFPLAGR